MAIASFERRSGVVVSLESMWGSFVSWCGDVVVAMRQDSFVIVRWGESHHCEVVRGPS